jgi:LVIVD repeat
MRAFAFACLICLAASASALAHDKQSSADLPLPELATTPAFAPVSDEVSTRAELRRITDANPSGDFELVGHEPLMNRGMNSALAVHGDHAYVGSRTDGSHANAGVLVVDVSDPSKPEVVDEIGLPNAGMPGESSRELRVMPEQELLMVLNHGCSELIHRCVNIANTGVSITTSRIDFYDISGDKEAAPELVSSYKPSRSAPQQPHEFFIWNDPKRDGRVLMYSTTPSSDTGTREQLIVTDLSQARDGEFPEIAKWRTTIGNPDRDNRLHSITVTPDGNRMMLAYLGGGFMVADTSDFADAEAKPEVRLVTPVEQRVFWTDPGAHSAIKVPGKPYALTTDEVYGKLGGVLADHGCPWGWVRMIDIRDESRPKVANEFRLPVNDPNQCATTPPDRENLSSFSAHNPTLTEHLAFVTWHSAGLQAIDLSNPRKPRSAAQFVPEPLDFVQTEDPALSSGRDKVVMWSFPIIKDGLIYAIDLRNGLYILRYDGKHEREVARTEFLDGNSNSGDAVANG